METNKRTLCPFCGFELKRYNDGIGCRGCRVLFPDNVKSFDGERSISDKRDYDKISELTNRLKPIYRVKAGDIIETNWLKTYAVVKAWSPSYLTCVLPEYKDMTIVVEENQIKKYPWEMEK